jgi:hypothetical protein
MTLGGVSRSSVEKLKVLTREIENITFLPRHEKQAIGPLNQIELQAT